MNVNQSGNNSPLVSRVMEHANMTTIFRDPKPPIYSSSIQSGLTGEAEKAFVLPPQAPTTELSPPIGDVIEEQSQSPPLSQIPLPDVTGIQDKPVSKAVEGIRLSSSSERRLQPDSGLPQIPSETVVSRPIEASQTAPVQLQPEVPQSKPVTTLVAGSPASEQAALTSPTAGIKTAITEVPGIQEQPTTAEIADAESPTETPVKEEDKTDQRLHTIMRLHKEKAVREATQEASSETTLKAEVSDSKAGTESAQRQVEPSPAPKAKMTADSILKTLPNIPQPRRPRPISLQNKQSEASDVQSESESSFVQRSPEHAQDQRIINPNVASVSEARDEDGSNEDTPVQTGPEAAKPEHIPQDLASSPQSIQQKVDQNTGSDETEISTKMETAEASVDPPTVQTLPESKASVTQTADLSVPTSEIGDEFGGRDISEPGLLDGEPVTRGEQEIDRSVSSEAITVVSRPMDSEQIESSNQMVQLSPDTSEETMSNQTIQSLPEADDEPTMIIERRPSSLVKDQENDFQGSGEPKVDIQAQRKADPEGMTASDVGGIVQGDEPVALNPPEHKSRPLPLEEVWPVKVLSRQQTPAQGEVVAKTATPSISQVTGSQTLLRKLAAIPTEKPSDSSVAVMRPRIPRPVQQTADVQMQKQQPVTGAISANLTQHGQPVAEMVAESPTTVPTEIGDLPADLWTLIGQKAPVASDSSESTVQKKEEKIDEVSGSRNQGAMESGPVFPPLPKIQRLEEQSTAVPGAGATTEGEEEGKENGEAEIDVDSLALQVFSQIKRRLSVEWERGRGRYGREW